MAKTYDEILAEQRAERERQLAADRKRITHGQPNRGPVMTAAAVLVAHQGPFFNGVDERCSCGQPVRDGRDWAEHVAGLLPATPDQG